MTFFVLSFVKWIKRRESGNACYSKFVQINLEPFVDSVYRFALSLTRDRVSAEDLAQSCLLKACEKRTQLVDEKAIKAWLFRILVNLWKDQIKKRQINTDPSTDVEWLGNKSLSPPEIAVLNESQARLLKLMQTLPERQRTVLHLSAVDQLTIKDIARTLETTENSVKANLSIARKTLRKLLVQSEAIQNVSSEE